MGSKQSSEYQTKRNQFINNIDGKTIDVINDLSKEYSSYKGIKTDFGTLSEPDETLDTTNKNQTKPEIKTQNQNLNNPIDINFVWDGTGVDVFVTGSFVGWKQWFLLEKQGDIYHRKIPLTKEKHYFKFIIDKEWKCSENYETVCDENGNVNNFIDLTNIMTNDPKPQRKGTAYRKESKQSKDNSEIYQTTNSNTRKMTDNSYNEIYPERSGLNADTPQIPNSYTNKFNLNNLSFQNKIGKPSYINLNYKDIYNHTNSSASEISLPPHINM